MPVAEVALLASLCVMGPQRAKYIRSFYRAEVVLSEIGNEYAYPPPKRMHETWLSVRPHKVFKVRTESSIDPPAEEDMVIIQVCKPLNTPVG